MVHMTVRLTAAPGNAHQLLEALHALKRRTQREGGCCDARIGADVDEANVFWYSEDWPDAQALEGEMRGDRFSQLLALMETSARPPVLEFQMVAETRGLEYVAAVRGSEKA